MQTFPLPYLRNFDKKTKYANTEVVFASQKSQIQRNAVNPVHTWSFECSGVIEHLAILQRFHSDHAGNAVPFYFYDDNDVQTRVRFESPELQYKLVKELDTASPTASRTVGFTANIVVKSVL